MFYPQVDNPDGTWERKYFTKEELVRANNDAIWRRFNRSLEVEAVHRLPDLKFPVSFAFPHNDTEVRCQLVLDSKGSQASLDVTFETFDSLPTHRATNRDIEMAQLLMDFGKEPDGKVS